MVLAVLVLPARRLLHGFAKIGHFPGFATSSPPVSQPHVSCLPAAPAAR